MIIPNMIGRWGKPSKHDQVPYGTICKSGSIYNQIFEIYVQMSEDDKNPSWEKVGDFRPANYHLIEEEVKKILSLKQNR